MNDGQLAKLLGLKSQSEVSDYKKRSDPPHALRALVIAQQYGVDPGWLAFGHDCAAPGPDSFAGWLARERSKADERAFDDGAEIPTLKDQAFEEIETPSRATGTGGRLNAKKRR